MEGISDEVGRTPDCELSEVNDQPQDVIDACNKPFHEFVPGDKVWCLVVSESLRRIKMALILAAVTYLIQDGWQFEVNVISM